MTKILKNIWILQELSHIIDLTVYIKYYASHRLKYGVSEDR